MERPNKKDYDFNDVFEGARFAANMIKYCDYIEQKLQEAQEQVKNIAYEPVLAVVCDWRLVDNGMMGCHDYEYETTCGRTLDRDTTTNANYCPYCGGKRNNH